jgi:hypothetical protein
MKIKIPTTVAISSFESAVVGEASEFVAGAEVFDFGVVLLRGLPPQNQGSRHF